MKPSVLKKIVIQWINTLKKSLNVDESCQLNGHYQLNDIKFFFIYDSCRIEFENLSIWYHAKYKENKNAITIQSISNYNIDRDINEWIRTVSDNLGLLSKKSKK